MKAIAIFAILSLCLVPVVFIGIVLARVFGKSRAAPPDTTDEDFAAAFHNSPIDRDALILWRNYLALVSVVPIGKIRPETQMGEMETLRVVPVSDLDSLKTALKNKGENIEYTFKQTSVAGLILMLAKHFSHPDEVEREKMKRP